jgi:DNA-binding NtrC family response regulator
MDTANANSPRAGKSSPSLLIVDDDPLIRDSLTLSLSGEFDIYAAESRAQAVALLRDMPTRPRLALIDLGLPPFPHRPEEGFHLIAELLAHSPQVKILALSGQDEESNARHARALGALDFIAKPCKPELIRQQLHNAMAIIDNEQAHDFSGNDSLLGIVGQSKPMQAMRNQIVMYANTPFPVLIEGESGSGKELVASALQLLGANSKSPYLIFNCAAVSPNLLEASLFGYAKGAFTGALNATSGYFEDAGDGTLFLDEIGELPLELQAKLLRVLENGEYQRVGETATRKSHARIIAATNRNLRQEVRSGSFRTDLYHRLSVFTVQVPPLRELGADKFLLLNHFRSFYAEQAKSAQFELDASALHIWERYPFPGNTRELRNIVIRLATKYPGRTIADAQLAAELDLLSPSGSDGTRTNLQQQAHLALQQPDFSLDDMLMEQERLYISAALDIAQNNISEAAKLLGINRTTLYSRMESQQKRMARKDEEQ